MKEDDLKGVVAMVLYAAARDGAWTGTMNVFFAVSSCLNVMFRLLSPPARSRALFNLPAYLSFRKSAAN